MSKRRVIVQSTNERDVASVSSVGGENGGADGAGRRPIRATQGTFNRAKRVKGSKERGKETHESDVPTIKGCPPHIVPMLLQALKSRRKAFSSQLKAADVGFSTYGPDSKAAIDDVTGGILDKLREVTRRESKDQIMVRRAADDATESFLQALRREESISGSRPDATFGGDSDPANGSSTSVSVACVVFLLGLFHDPSVKIMTRRSVLVILGEILKRSCSSRQYFTQAEQIREFVSSVSRVGSSVDSSNESNSIASAMQSDAATLLDYLSKKFGAIYPRLTVAARFLEERSGLVAKGEADGHVRGSKAMADLRQARDIALNFGDREMSRVNQILHRADVCFEILVPRIHESNIVSFASDREKAKASKYVGDTSNNNAEMSNWSDDDVDWEDGDINSDSFSEGASCSIGPTDHEEAVERTMTLLEKSGGVMGGGVEVDFDNNDSSESHVVSSHDHGGKDNDELKTRARSRLQKYVDLLSCRHLPRLADWVYSLTYADNMMNQNQPHSPLKEPTFPVQSSLVLIPSSSRIKRGHMLQSLMDLKVDVSRVLAAASRLGITAKSDTVGNRHDGGNPLGNVESDGNSNPGAYASLRPMPANRAALSSSALRSALGIGKNRESISRKRSFGTFSSKPVSSSKNFSRVQIKVRKN